MTSWICPKSLIRRTAGILYDPAIVETCMKLFREKGYAPPQ